MKIAGNSEITTSALLDSFTQDRQIVLVLGAILNTLGGSIVLDTADLAAVNPRWAIEIQDHYKLGSNPRVSIRLLKNE